MNRDSEAPVVHTLAIDCATEACSVALFADGALIASDHRVLGRGHAEQLVPMIAALPGRGIAGRILVSLGPGSFTGVRIGIATARALGYAWSAQVLGYPTLALVAAMALRENAGSGVAVAMTGGHGEWFVQCFDAAGAPLGAQASLAPAQACTMVTEALIAGNQAQALVAGRGSGRALAILPDARCTPLLPPALLTGRLAPIYGRGPDARLPA